MKGGKILFHLAAIITMFMLLFSNNLYAEELMISIPTEKIAEGLKEGDRISEFKIELYAGQIYGILKIADDWWVKTKYAETPQVYAWAFHGAGFLSVNDIKKQNLFNNFLTIKTWPEDGEFDITVYFTLENAMEEKPKHMSIKKKDMTISPIK